MRVILGRKGLGCLQTAIAPDLYRIVANIKICAEIKLLKVKVPLICLGTKDVSLHRDGRYTVEFVIMFSYNHVCVIEL